MALSESLQKRISDLLATNRIVLFMKGTRRMPQCGFSGQVVQILDELLPSYETVDVLRSPELRDAIKEFSQWPTIPQLYVGGKFIGGCDIVREMNASGELQKLLISDTNEPPKVKQLSAPELKAMLDRREVILFDVRPESERAIARIARARPLDAAGQEYLTGIDRDAPIVFHCHHGIRSQAVAEQVLREGFRNVYNLKGGIEAWSQTVDSSVPRY